MTFVIQTSSYRFERRRLSANMEALRIGLIGASAAVYLALVGIIESMADRWIIYGYVPISLLILGSAAAFSGYAAARHADGTGRALTLGIFAGLLTGLGLAGLTFLVAHVDFREIVITAGPGLVRILSFGKPPEVGYLGLPVAGALIGGAAGWVAMTGAKMQRAVMVTLLTLVFAALLKDVVVSVLAHMPWRLAPSLFGATGLRTLPAALLCLAVFAAAYWQPMSHAVINRLLLPRRTRIAMIVLGIAFALLLPLVTNAFVAQVMVTVGLYVLMAVGLNIELGFAGLVDLGFVAFFAIGAYTVALLSSEGPYALAALSFWACLPIAVMAAALGGFIFGLPVLRVRGDYLAMATLGLGEIIRVLVLSDALKPYLGGSQGIGEVVRPEIAGMALSTPKTVYFLLLVLIAIVIAISRRLEASRIGRAWQAIREDEDVAQALGIDPVSTKLFAYTIGAAFAGAAGAVFAISIGGVYPHSFQLIVSTNVLAILVIGGLRSIGGVICGALALIGIPELLREFGEFRYLVYGVALIATMYYRPGGLWQPRSSEAS